MKALGGCGDVPMYHGRYFAIGAPVKWLRSKGGGALEQVDCEVVRTGPKRIQVRDLRWPSLHWVDPQNVIGGTFYGIH